MRSSRVARASYCQCRRRNSPGFDPSNLQYSGIWGGGRWSSIEWSTQKKFKQNPPSINLLNKYGHSTFPEQRAEVKSCTYRKLVAKTLPVSRSCFPPSCISRLVSFLATRLNLIRNNMIEGNTNTQIKKNAQIWGGEGGKDIWAAKQLTLDSWSHRGQVPLGAGGGARRRREGAP